MEKVTIWTNNFYYIAEEVDKALAEGKAVRVGADCIGHTRAAMIKANAASHFKSAGAVEVEHDTFGTYYALPQDDQ